MAIYHYKALKDNKVEVKGVLEAESSDEARAKVQAMGFLPTNIFEEKPNLPQIQAASGLKFLSLNDKILFTSELSVMLASGISVVEALETAEIHAPKPQLKMLAADLKTSLLKGATFTDAIKAYEKVFGNLYISLCEAGETSGTLDKSMEYLTGILKKQNELKSKMISMSIYPVCLVVLLAVVYIIFGKFVFPAFINGANLTLAEAPFMVKLMTVPCEFMFSNFINLIITVAALFFGIRYLVIQQSFKEFMDRKLLSMPKVKDFIRYINLAAYFNVLTVAYDAGVPISSALKLSANTVSNTVIKREADNAERCVTNGQELAKSFSISNLLPPTLNVLVASGEKAGRLGQMFKDVSSEIDRQLQQATDVLVRAFEPLVIMILGLFVGYVIIAFAQMYGCFMNNAF